jgi:hypothetical protein
MVNGIKAFRLTTLNIMRASITKLSKAIKRSALSIMKLNIL